MRAVIKPSLANGTVAAPSSKSVAHRLLIAAALAEGDSTVYGVTPSDDVLATIDCLNALGATIELKENVCKIHGVDMKSTAANGLLCCRESGSTLRFLIPIAALSGSKVMLSGSETLLSRPLSVYERLFEERELLLKKIGNFIFVDGPLPSGEYEIDGNVSSQFISGLLFALPLAEGDSLIRIKPPFASKSYVDLTIEALSAFGVNVCFEDSYTVKIPGGQKYTPKEVSVEGDYSGAAFLDAFNYLGGEVSISGLNEASSQGDKAYRELFPLLKKAESTIDLENCPDLAPILFTLAADCNGALFTSTARLKIKESDRAQVMAEELKKFGADIEVFEDSVKIKKASLHTPCEILNGHNDHRVVMSLAVLCSKYGGIIDGAEAVKKSYPRFFEDIKNAGIEVELYE